MPLKNELKSCFLSALLWAGCAGWAQAEIYKSVDAEGHVTYSSTPSKGAKRLGLEPLAPPSRATGSSRSSRSSSSSYSPRARDRETPYDFPRVDSATQKRRDDMRYKILSDELASEEKLLAEARTSLKQGEASRSAGTEGKLRALQEDVTLHERNIGALRTELSSIK